MTDEPRPDTAPPSRLQAEIGQTRPFGSASQEAMLSIARTASVLDRTIARYLAPFKLSPAQYNVLRILRGAGPGGLPTLAIRGRLIDPSAAITRLIDKLEQAGLVRRSRESEDRREVICRITPDGLALLERLDPIVTADDNRLAPDLSPAELRQLIDLLDRVRENLR
ncbi:MAG: MarR family transcriptional regulator [Gemmatimonadota bacterium]